MALTGYRITEFIDVNPNSPTYNQTRQSRTLDSECSPVAANWVELTSFCELDEHGKVTGYYIHVQVDQAEGSDTYGETREVKETAAQGQCVDAEDNPNWTIDPYYNSRCETKTYEPSMIVGDTGRYLTKLVDDNVYSPTYKTSVESALTESDWETLFSDPFPCETPNTQPDIKAISQYCETSGGTNTGYLIVNGMDKNPYSSTYLTVTSSKTYDEQSCPVSTCDKYEFYDVGGEVSSSGSVVSMGYSSTAEADLSFSSEKSDSWITLSHIQRGRVYKAYMCTIAANNTGAERTGYAVFTSTDGCEFSGTVTQAGAVDCSKYGFEATSNIIPSSGGDKVLAESVFRKGQLTFDAASSAPWITEGIPISTTDTIYYHFNVNSNSGLRREGALVFTSNDGNCEFSGTVIQAAQATAVNITFSGLPPNLTSGGLSMTGSTYTAQFILAGPNAGTGTLYGTLSPSDSRQVMTFSGQFTLTSGGGNIVNACDGTSTSLIYTVSTASWYATTSTLDVNFTKCS